MRDRDAHWIAGAAGADLLAPGYAGAGGIGGVGRVMTLEGGLSSVDALPGPVRVLTDSRDAGPGDLFVGIPGERVDGGTYAAEVLASGAWGVLVAPEHAEAVAEATATNGVRGAVLAHPDPVAALGALALAWRRELAAVVVGVTGSVGKTSTKDLLAALLAPHRRTAATAGNHNTEIGLPLTVLGAPRDTEVLVLEMAMRGAGQIAELARIAEPDVGVVTNIAPVHLEILGSLEAIADAKAELLHGVVPGGTGIVPADERLLDGHRPGGVRIVTFGPDGSGADVAGPFEGLELVGPAAAGMRRNLAAAVAVCRAVGVEPAGAVEVSGSAMRGDRVHLPGDVVVVVDCYNANPMSTVAALDDLRDAAEGRRVAVLGDMLELGPDERRLHAEVGAHARTSGVDELVVVGELSRHTGTGFGGAVHWVADADAAGRLLRRLVEPGDTVLLKASRGVGLERALAVLQDTEA